MTRDLAADGTATAPLAGGPVSQPSDAMAAPVAWPTPARQRRWGRIVMLLGLIALAAVVLLIRLARGG